MTPTREPPTRMNDVQIIRLFAQLRWTLLRGVLRTTGVQRWAVLVGFTSSLIVGVAAVPVLSVAGQRSDDPTTFFVITSVGITIVVVMVGVIAGVTQPVDPRVLATQPLSSRQMGIGLLTASAVGPPAVSAVLVGVGLAGGAIRGFSSVLPVALAVSALMVTLLLVSRSTINALGLLATRFPRAGQILIGVSSLIFYAMFQLLPRAVSGLNDDERNMLADILAWTPPGQIGRALGAAGTSAAVALLHVLVGAVWLIALILVFAWTTRQLIVSVRNDHASSSGQNSPRRRPISQMARRLCGSGAIGAVAWRGVLTRMRTPRTALETFTGAGIGMAIVLVPALTRDEAGAGAVIVGGAVQLAVLFMAGNSFGSDGPALANELLTGVDSGLLVRAKARSVLVVALPVALASPFIAAALTSEWKYLPAGFLVGVGGLLSGTGGAIVQSTLVPIAIPESDNPLASGESGKGCFAGITLGVVLIILAVLTLPVALALLWAVERQSVGLVTLFAVATVAAGALVLHSGIRFASRKWRLKEPEIYAAIVPTR